MMLCSACAAVPKQADKTSKLRSETELRSDVDFVYRKLQKFHPRLNWYISREELDFKFDSLKSTIVNPMTSKEFYLKLSPVISSIKQGHNFTLPLLSKEMKKEFRSKARRESSPLAPFEFELVDDKLFIVKNTSLDSSIKIGTEVISMNGLEPSEIFSTYRFTFSSDGYNQTYAPHWLGKSFGQYYVLHTGISDSIHCQLKYDDTISNVYLKRKIVTAKSKEKKHNHESPSENQITNEETPSFRNGHFKFIDEGYETAVLTIDRFSGQRYYAFLKYCFTKLQAHGTRNLILDLRDNPGGNAAAASKLYSYLTPKPFIFLDEMDVTSKTSILHTPYFLSQPLWAKAILVLYLPFRLIDLGTSYFKVRKRDDDTYYYSTPLAKPMSQNKLVFNGHLYVLINGATFSASSILSSNLDGSGRAVFVGEETGGAYNGTVAGKFSLIKLPASKLHVIFGLAAVKPYHKTNIEGHGIFPDIYIKPTLQDIISGNDPEMNWILDDIEGHRK